MALSFPGSDDPDLTERYTKGGITFTIAGGDGDVFLHMDASKAIEMGGQSTQADFLTAAYEAQAEMVARTHAKLEPGKGYTVIPHRNEGGKSMVIEIKYARSEER